MLRTLLSAAAFACLITPVTTDAWAQQPTQAVENSSPLRIRYVGELIDAERMPVSGVFRLVFQLTAEDAAAPAWSETHFVTIGEGQFALILGTSAPLPTALENSRATLRIGLVGGEEISRHPLTVTRYVPGPPEAQPAFERVTFADLAARAIVTDSAEYARNGERFNGQTVDEFSRYEEIQGRIEELRERLRTDGGAQIGTDYIYLSPFGGPNGNRYEHICPAGFVVTGVRGGAGRVIDGFVPTCTQIR
jgi:hypothetical protein